MSEEEYTLKHEGRIEIINEALHTANQVDKILENINPHTIRSIIHSLVHQHPEVAETMLEELGYYKEQGSF